MLEEEGFLTTIQEDVHLTKGKTWRVHYWILKTDQISRLAAIPIEEQHAKDDPYSVYDKISSDIWARQMEEDSG